MKRLTFEGDFCDIAMCLEVKGGAFCREEPCSQYKVWSRLKQFEDVLEEFPATFCDTHCRWKVVCMNQERLSIHCATCPLKKILDMKREETA